MSGKHIIAVGHAALDYVYRIDAFPPAPTKLQATAHVASGGGMAANASAAIARLGGNVSLWTRIGDDAAGGVIRHQLRAAGVGTTHVRVFEGVSSPTSAVIVDKRGERLVVSEDGHEFPLTADWLPLSDIAGAAVVMSDLTWLEGTLTVFTEARTHGVPTVLDIDVDSGDLLKHVIGLTDYAIFSAPAFRSFLPEGSDEERLRRLVQSGIRHAGVTLGSKGYLWCARGGRSGFAPAFRVDVVDTTGAGDAFHGAFAWSVAQGLDEADCIRNACAVAAMSCTGLGARAALPGAAQLASFLAEVR